MLGETLVSNFARVGLSPPLDFWQLEFLLPEDVASQTLGHGWDGIRPLWFLGHAERPNHQFRPYPSPRSALRLMIDD